MYKLTFICMQTYYKLTNVSNCKKYMYKYASHAYGLKDTKTPRYDLCLVAKLRFYVCYA